MPKMMKKKSPKQQPKRKRGMLVMEEDKPFVCFNDSEWYVGRLKDHEVKEGNFGPYLTMTFEVLNGEMEDGTSAKGKKCNAMLDATLSPSSKLYSFVKVLEGGDVDKGESIDISAYYGKKVKIFIEDKKQKKGQAKSDKRFQNVTKLKPLVKKKA